MKLFALFFFLLLLLLFIFHLSPSSFVHYKAGSRHVTGAVTFHPSASVGFSDVCQHAQL